MRRVVSRAALLALAGGLAGCAQSACSQPDVVAYVDKATQLHDLYAIGVEDGAVRETPIAVRSAAPGRQLAPFSTRAAVCSAWLLSRNPAYQPGNGQSGFVRSRQDYWVAKVAEGYEVGILRH